jgi:hypothetical protein
VSQFWREVEGQSSNKQKARSIDSSAIGPNLGSKVLAWWEYQSGLSMMTNTFWRPVTFLMSFLVQHYH